MKKPKPTTPTGERSRFASSRVAQGLTLLPSIDGRSTWARIMRDVYNSMLAHAGGADYVSETRKLMARRVAACEAELIHLRTVSPAPAPREASPPPATSTSMAG